MNTIRFAMLSVALLSCAVQAADPYPQQQLYAQQVQYPQQQYPQQGYPQQQGGQAHPMRKLFAQSLASVAQSTGSAAIVAVADGLTGALKGWFDNRRQRKNTNGALGDNYAPNTMQAQGYPAGAPMQPQNYPAPSPNTGGYPAPNDSYAYPGTMPSNTNGYPSPEAYPPPDNGYVTSGGASGGYPDEIYPPTPSPALTAPQLYAGIAYEIHLLQRDGSTLPVDPAGHAFRTGDQFRVYYRPSLPGRVDVYNINAAGQQAQIDSSVIAAGELASLGPYQFTDMQGEETLILTLSPCVTPVTYQTTRNIVKAQGGQNYPANNPMAANNPLGFDSCSTTATRSLKDKPKTRDIKKVSVEGGTSFALDPIGANELGQGDMAPRQVTITLHHR